jgi:hypothetical protein
MFVRTDIAASGNHAPECCIDGTPATFQLRDWQRQGQGMSNPRHGFNLSVVTRIYEIVIVNKIMTSMSLNLTFHN